MSNEMLSESRNPSPENETSRTDADTLRWLANGDNFAKGTKAVMRRSADRTEQLERELAQEKKAHKESLHLLEGACSEHKRLQVELAQAKRELTDLVQRQYLYAERVKQKERASEALAEALRGLSPYYVDRQWHARWEAARAALAQWEATK